MKIIRPRWIFAFAAALVFCSPFFAQGPAAAPDTAPDAAWWANDDNAGGISAPRYSGVDRASRYITLKDGVRLALDIYLPKGLEAGARLPAILEQTRYNRSYELQPEIREKADRPSQKVTEFVTRGYAYVIVDVRGSGASFGNRRAELGPQEVRDGSEVVDWIIKQPWSDGKVGAMGVSYVGSTAELLLVNRHPAVKAIVPQFSLFDSYPDIAFPGGIQHTWFLRVWGKVVSDMDRNVISEQARQRIVGVRPVDEDAGRSLLARAFAEHATNIDVAAEMSRVTFRDDRAPANWTLDDVSPFTYLRELRSSGAAIYSYSDTMGEEKWHAASAWPLPQTQVQQWYFGSNHTLGRISPKNKSGYDSYKVDYSTGTGNQSRWNTLVGGGPVDYPDRAAEDGKLLTYTSAPLEHDLEVTGHPVMRLFVSSTATDGQFFVYLEEVDEQGRVRYVTEGQLRAINRKISNARPPYKTFGLYRTFLRRDAQPLVPGQVAELSFDLLPTSNLFRKGRRIRVAIAGADKDHFEPPTGDPPTVRVYRGGNPASRIYLPVIPRK